MHNVRVIYGYGPQDAEYLLQADGTPTELVRNYADRHSITLEKALGTLEEYQHKAKDFDSDCWLFGIEVFNESVESSAGLCFPFIPVGARDNEALDRDLLEEIRGKGILRECIDEDLVGVLYHVVVEPSP